MAETYYSGTAEEVMALVSDALRLGEGSADLKKEDVQPFMQDADDIINGVLSTTYLVPLRRCKWNGVLVYPPPIPNIARRIAAGTLMEKKYSETQPNASILGKKLREEAIVELAALAVGIGEGKKHLRGQVLLSKNIFGRPTVIPKPVPGTPQETPSGGIAVP